MKLAICVAAAFCVTAGLVAQSRLPDRPALSGYVLTPEGLPVPSGTVTVKAPLSERTTTIDSTGRFRIEALAPGVYDVSVSAPRLMTHRLRLTMPSSGSLLLPPIRLSSGSYLRFRFLAPGGQPIEWPRITRTSFDLTGARIPETSGEFAPNQMDPQGATVIGPVPPGMTVLSVDPPPYARMRLRDVRVTGGSPLIDAGTVTLQPGAVLKVTIVDAARVPVPNHPVILEDGRAPSPLWWPPVRTDMNGNATFDRLASGRYYVRTSALEECGGFYPPPVSRRIDAPPRGAIEARVVVDGRATLRLMTGGTALQGKLVSLTPDTPSPAMPAWLRSPSLLVLKERSINRFREASCLGTTDANGRVRFANVPPGPARLALRVGNSTWVRRLELAADDREVVLQIPSGFLPVHIVDASSGAPVNGAIATWLSGGAQVEATASATGDALLEGVSERPGSLIVEAQNYERREVKLAGPPDVLHEVALERSASLELHCRIVTDAGAPIAAAVVELAPHDRLEMPQVAMTDRDGLVLFLGSSAGPFRLVARAERYAASIVHSVTVPSQPGDPVTVALSRGHRIVVIVEAAAGEGPHALRVITEGGAGMDDLLDSASDRIVQGFGRVSLGPLPRGTYIVELGNGSEKRRQLVRIEDGDVELAFR